MLRTGIDVPLIPQDVVGDLSRAVLGSLKVAKDLEDVILNI